ncbi:MAG: glucokinase [Aquabacterium sp.]|nr:glucokinase [Aquabacterium sp.]
MSFMPTEAMLQPSYPRLLGDIGGTHARLALQLTPTAPIEHIVTLPVADHDGLQAAVVHYLSLVGADEGASRPRSASMGIAAPVLGDHIQMINAPWAFSVQAVKQAMGWDAFNLLNDFTVLALSLPALPESELRQLGGGQPMAGMTKALIGAGTGLGVSGLVPMAGGLWAPLAGEGGHVTLPPSDDAERRLLAELHKRYPHVSAERVLSGSGLAVLYEAHARMAGAEPVPLMPADVSQRGLSGQCAHCTAALHSFCNLLGTVASNLAVTLGAQGGLYIGGGIVPRLGAFFEQSGFRARFDAKGRYSDYMASIPVYIIQSAYPALVGASRA